MTMRYLIDTDWVIHYLNGREDIVRRLDELKEQGLALSPSRPYRRATLSPLSSIS